jgi:hypothetical protein
MDGPQAYSKLRTIRLRAQMGILQELSNSWHEADKEEPGFRYLVRYSIAPNVLISFANVQY